MSDYLWDKTGEPDAETERLENLLGQLRFQPTPFDLPAELPAKLTTGELRAVRARNVLSWPRLAFAASITLAVLAGAWLALKQQTAATNDAPRIAEQNNKQSGAGDNRSAVASEATGAAREKDAIGEKKGNETPAAAPSQGGEPQREQRAGGRVSPQRPDLADNDRSNRLPRSVKPRAPRAESARTTRRRDDLTPRAQPERREEIALSEQEREAAEKVLYALRVTSEKLNYARQQVHDAGRREGNR